MLQRGIELVTELCLECNQSVDMPSINSGGGVGLQPPKPDP